MTKKEELELSNKNKSNDPLVITSDLEGKGYKVTLDKKNEHEFYITATKETDGEFKEEDKIERSYKKGKDFVTYYSSHSHRSYGSK